MLRHRLAKRACASLAFSLMMSSGVFAQDGQSCVFTSAASGPDRQIVTCGDALTLEREPAAGLRIVERSNNAAPRVIEVDGGAILIEVKPGSAPTEIRTPHAIATVRGTTYVVDAGTDESSIFVLKGAVAVQRVNDASSVVLGPGEGADVMPGSQVVTNTWSKARADALLARFGR